MADRWRERLQGIGASGREFAPEHEEENLSAAAAAATRRLLATQPRPKAVIFSDFPAAMGGYRALWEAGLQPGKDLDVAALTCEPAATFLAPSLTSLAVPTRESVIAEPVDLVLERRATERRNWSEAMLTRIRLKQGESSGRSR